MQGGTFSKLIMSAHPKPFPPHMSIEAWYVFISRVKKLKGLRLLHKPSASDGGLTNLTDLRHSIEMRVWDEGYDERGCWSAGKARAAAASIKAQAPRKPPKRKRRRATHADSARAQAAVDAQTPATAAPRCRMSFSQSAAGDAGSSLAAPRLVEGSDSD